MNNAIKKQARTRGFTKVYTNKDKTAFIKEWEGWEHEPFLEGKKIYQALFRYLVGICAYKNTFIQVDGKRIELKRGQCFTTNPEIVKTLERAEGVENVTENKIRLALKKFKDAGKITDESFNKGRVITFLEYEEYQGIKEKDNVYHYNFQKNRIIDNAKDFLNISKKTTGKTQAENSQTTDHIYNKDKKRNYTNSLKEKKIERKYKENIVENENLQTSLSFKKEGEGQNDTSLQKEEDKKLFTAVKEEFVKAFNLNPDELKTKDVANRITEEKKVLFLNQIKEKNLINEQIGSVWNDVFKRKQGELSKKGLQDSMAYYFKPFLESLEDTLKKEEKAKEERLKLKPKIESKELQVTENIFELNGEFANAVDDNAALMYTNESPNVTESNTLEVHCYSKELKKYQKEAINKTAIALYLSENLSIVKYERETGRLELKPACIDTYDFCQQVSNWLLEIFRGVLKNPNFNYDNTSLEKPEEGKFINYYLTKEATK